MNLGFTSFMDAVPLPPGYGWYANQRFIAYNTQEFTNAHGGRLGGVPSPRYNPVNEVTQIAYLKRDKGLFNSYLGFTALFPGTLTYQLQTPNALGLKANSPGMGNPIIGPVFQWDPVMRKGRPFWYNRIEIDNFIPVGKYNKKYQLNPGTPFYSFAPYWSTTVFINSKWDFSSRLHYLWSAKNNQTGIQAGSAIHDNFATSYLVIDQHLRLGVAGYFLQQLNNSRGNPEPNSKERVLGIGPGAVILLTPQTAINLNYYKESYVENRTKGNRCVLNINHAFADLL